jgi:hypothetical protein
VCNSNAKCKNFGTVAETEIGNNEIRDKLWQNIIVENIFTQKNTIDTNVNKMNCEYVRANVVLLVGVHTNCIWITNSSQYWTVFVL